MTASPPLESAIIQHDFETLCAIVEHRISQLEHVVKSRTSPRLGALQLRRGVSSTSSSSSTAGTSGIGSGGGGGGGGGMSSSNTTAGHAHGTIRRWGSVTEINPEGILRFDDAGSSSEDDGEDTTDNNDVGGGDDATSGVAASDSVGQNTATIASGDSEGTITPPMMVPPPPAPTAMTLLSPNLNAHPALVAAQPPIMPSPSDFLRELANSPIPRRLSTNESDATARKKLARIASKVKRTRTKIICAIGPACQDKDMLGALLDAGMNVARLNFSHNTHEYHATSVRNLKAAIQERRDRGQHCRCAILLDTKGPEIRTGMLVGNKKLALKTGQRIEVSSLNYDVPGDDTVIKCSYEFVAQDVKPGSKILIADGELTLNVLDCFPERSAVLCEVENDFMLGEKKNVNLPGVRIKIDSITDKDRYDIANFALVHDIDIISGSFVRTAANVRALRDCLQGAKIRVHAKVESVEALQNLHEILAEADGVHVSRGDLGMELALPKLALAQKAIIHAANMAGKPVVTSTQTLQSMVEKPRPTNAECTDVANAVLDGSDCIMLSAETASGKYPREAVAAMARIITQAERLINFEHDYLDIREMVLKKHGGKVSVMEAVCSSAVEVSIDLRSRLIVVASDSGRMGLLVGKYRPRARVLLVTESDRVANQMSVTRGVEAVVAPSIENLDYVWDFVVNKYLTREDSPWCLPPNHPVVLVDSPKAGYDSMRELSKPEVKGKARWNMLRVMRVPERSKMATMTMTTPKQSDGLLVRLVSE